jgi:hypothetical protein
MIGVEGQYIFKFSLENEEDFIQEEDLAHFSLIEDAGGVLPTFELEFRILSDKTLLRLNEGNILKVSFGVNLESLQDSELIISKLESSMAGDGKRTVLVKGFYNKLGYVSDPVIGISDKISSFEEIKNVAGKHFKIISSGNSSEDSQNWIQYNITDKAHINNVFIHSNVSGSFPCMGITSVGEFIISDFKSILSSQTPYRWRFCNGVEDKNKDIIYDPDSLLKDTSGIMNNWSGYGRSKLVYNKETGEEENVTEDSKPLLSLSNVLHRRSDLKVRRDEISFKSENTHNNYWNAYLRNMNYLTTYSSTSLILSFSNVFKNVKILDLIFYKDDETDSRKKHSSEAHVGLYLITKVARTVTNRQFITVVDINRESFNQIKGDLR